MKKEMQKKQNKVTEWNKGEFLYPVFPPYCVSDYRNETAAHIAQF